MSKRSRLGGFVAALLITACVLIGTSAAFADTIPAPVFDHSVTAKPGYVLITVRSSPSGQATGDLGYLDLAKSYPSGTAVTGPPSYDGPLWIPIRYNGAVGFVNAADVVVGAPLPVRATQAPNAAPTTPTAAAAAAKAPTQVTTAAPAGQVTISTSTIWLALTALLSIAAALVSYFTSRPVFQLSAAGIAAASAITMAILRPAGSGMPTAAGTLVVILAASTAVFIAVLRRFDGERPAMQLLHPAFRDWKFTTPVAAAALVPAIIFAALGQSQLVSAAVVLIAAAAVGAWRFAVFTNTDRPQPQQVEPDVYKPRGFDPSTEGARRG